MSWPHLTTICVAVAFGAGYALLAIWAVRAERHEQEREPGALATAACTCGARITGSLADLHAFITSHGGAYPGHEVTLLDVPDDEGDPT